MIRFVGFVENLNQLSLRLDINNLIQFISVKTLIASWKKRRKFIFMPA